MFLKSVETTPNPNSMKLNFDCQLGATRTYESQREQGADTPLPGYARDILALDGIKSIFICADFITLNKEPRADWKVLLKECAALFSSASDAVKAESGAATVNSVAAQIPATISGENQVLVQTFKGIPLQVKVVDAGGETRLSLGELYNHAAQLVQKAEQSDYLKERYWADHGVRYGERELVANEVLQELQGIYGRNEINEILARFNVASSDETTSQSDWQKRLKTIHTLSQTGGDTTIFSQALKDENAQVRRLAAAALGASGDLAAVPDLCRSLLDDASVAVRRTAGDALSDLGDAAAQESMCVALKDASKLVRWRAARFLNEKGTPEALPYLKAAVNDDQFEVKLEVEAAIDRIESGGDLQMPAWKRIAGLES